MISRYRIAAWRDEADIILCTALIGNLSKKAFSVYGSSCGHGHEPSEQVKHEIIYKSVQTDNFVRKYALVLLYGIILRCRSPPLVLHFRISTITKWRTSPMAKYQKKTNYREKYPGLSNDIIEVLEKSDRKMEYQQYDIKVERCRIDYASGTVTYLPSREDSYDRLLEENRQFAADSESVDDAAIKAVMIEKMLACLSRITPDEQNLITELFFNGKSEHQLSKETGIPQRTVHDRKVKILAKLKKLMEM